MSLRRIVVASAALTLAAGLAACSSSEGDDTTLRISASSTPHVEILDQIVSTGALGDYKLDIVEITGEVDPNELLEAGDVDANFFQHEPYLTDWQKQKVSTTSSPSPTCTSSPSASTRTRSPRSTS